MEITVYSKPNCVQCEQTKSFLTRKGIEFNIVDISVDKDALVKVQEMGYRQVPVVVTESEHWSGFQPAKLTALNS